MQQTSPRLIPMNVCVLFNPKAGSAQLIEVLREQFGRRTNVRMMETADRNEVKKHIVEAVTNGCDLIAVAGGDGTIHTAVNALGPDFPPTPLAVLPLGTGNDLCRTLAIPLDPLEAVELLPAGKRRAIDLIQIKGADSRYAINAVTGGFSGRVAHDVTSELKGFLGPFAYLAGALGTVANPPSYVLTIRFNDDVPEVFEALNIVVANGRTAAGGFVIAPNANPEDGLLDVVVVRSGDIIDLSIIAARLMEGDYLADENVVYRRVKRVEINSEPPLPVSIDGELSEGSHFVFEAVPQTLQIVVGPDYIAEPQPPPIEPDTDEPDDPRPREIAQRLFGLMAAELRLIRAMPVVFGIGFLVGAIAILGFTGLALMSTAGVWREANEAVLWYWHANATPELDRAAIVLTYLGNPYGTTAVTTLLVLGLLARRRYLDAATLLACVVGCGVLMAVLKTAFALPRPDLFPPLVPEKGYTFPSGHALLAVGLYGALAALIVSRNMRSATRWLIASLLVLLAVGICWSRIYQGVHYPIDVAAGILAGVWWVSGCLLARHYAQRRMVLNQKNLTTASLAQPSA
jgi:diacylglycerol kinase (ATP)